MVDAKKYWYMRLPRDGQRTYDSICSALKRGGEEAEVYTDNSGIRSDTQSAVMRDNPQYFWFNSKIRWSTCGRLTTAHFQNLYSRREIAAANAEIGLSERVVRGANELEIEKNIAEYLVRRVTYQVNDTYNQNMASAIYYKRAQCSGIASAVKYLCDVHGIWCIRVDGRTYGETRGPHSWNIVNIDGKFYHLDVTAMLGANSVKAAQPIYAYFNYSDAEIAVNHKWDVRSVPACPEKFSGSGAGILIYANLSEMRSGIEKTLKEGKKSISFILKVGDNGSEKLKLAMSGAKMVAQKLNFYGGFSVEGCGDNITITFNG